MAVLDDELVVVAQRTDCVLELVPMMGDFVPAGAPLFRVHGDAADLDPSMVAPLVLLGSERTHVDDAPYGFRKLVDIAVRSVAQPFDDPTTCVQALDRLHDGLRQLASRPFPSGRHCDERGQLRLVVRTITWDGYVRLAFDEIRLAGFKQLPVGAELVGPCLVDGTDTTVVIPPTHTGVVDARRTVVLRAAP